MISLKTKEQALELAKKYLTNSVATPFFLIVEQMEALEYLRQNLSFSMKGVKTSYFCQEDSFPDFDALYNHLQDCTEATLLLGLGEATLFSGQTDILTRLKDAYFPHKVVILFRGSKQEIEKLQDFDRKFDSRRVCYVEGIGTLEVKQYTPSLAVSVDAEGFQHFLQTLESSSTEKITVKTTLPLQFTKEINRAYDLILEQKPEFSVPESYLTTLQWEEYLENDQLSGNTFAHWRNFIQEYQKPSSSYMKLVLSDCGTAEEFGNKILTSILEIPHKALEFSQYYQERKEILPQFKEIDLKSFLYASMIKDKDRIFYFTDVTDVEKRAILEAMSEFETIPKELPKIYPDLALYLSKFAFGTVHSDNLTAYFTEYRKLKVQNIVSEDFLSLVNQYALEGQRLFHSLDTQFSLVEKRQKPHTFLYWVDALGVEFVPYLLEKAKELGLSMEIEVGKSNLPTLTAPNREFYENWSGEKFDTKKLDNIKHNRGGNPYSGKTGEYLVEELTVLEEILEEVKMKLIDKKLKKVVVTSDHGASRLAVLEGLESKWKMNLSGEHSGRCCLSSPEDKCPPCSTEGTVFPHTEKEQKFWVLANYDRFQGGRKADVEVHGGASLEEVLVPVLTISLANTTLTFSNVTPIDEDITLHSKQYLLLFCENPVQQVVFRFQNRDFLAEPDQKTILKHRVVFEEKLRAGTYEGDIYVEGEFVQTITFTIRSAVTKNDDFFD